MTKSEECWRKRHEDCDGICLDSIMGCECPCHYDDEANADTEPWEVE